MVGESRYCPLACNGLVHSCMARVDLECGYWRLERALPVSLSDCLRWGCRTGCATTRSCCLERRCRRVAGSSGHSTWPGLPSGQFLAPWSDLANLPGCHSGCGDSELRDHTVLTALHCHIRCLYPRTHQPRFTDAPAPLRLCHRGCGTNDLGVLGLAPSSAKGRSW